MCTKYDTRPACAHQSISSSNQPSCVHSQFSTTLVFTILATNAATKIQLLCCAPGRKLDRHYGALRHREGRREATTGRPGRRIWFRRCVPAVHGHSCSGSSPGDLVHASLHMQRAANRCSPCPGLAIRAHAVVHTCLSWLHALAELARPPIAECGRCTDVPPPLKPTRPARPRQWVVTPNWSPGTTS